ncbi:MAG: hypothetical protein K0R50_1375 [Eubacterium sp.]|jgi:hypothetical protein|nr:hypothetical protein [Eubacterium sp.]
MQLELDGIKSKEVKFFDINNLAEIIPTNIPILKDMMARIDSFFIKKLVYFFD